MLIIENFLNTSFYSLTKFVETIVIFLEQYHFTHLKIILEQIRVCFEIILPYTNNKYVKQ